MLKNIINYGIYGKYHKNYVKECNINMAQKYNWDTYTNDTDLWKEKRMGQDKGNREILMLYLKKKKTTEGNES